MAPLSKARKHALKRHKENPCGSFRCVSDEWRGEFLSSAEYHERIAAEVLLNLSFGLDRDEDPLELSDANFDNMPNTELQDMALQLTWNNNALTHVQLRGDSDRSQQRRAQNIRKRERSVEGQRGSILQYFNAVVELEDFGVDAFLPQAVVDVPVADVEETMETMRTAMAILNGKLGFANLHNNARLHKNLIHVSFYSHFQHLAVLRYFQLRLTGIKRTDASIAIAHALWPTTNRTNQPYKGYCIRRWSTQFLNTGEIKESRQGKHPKTHSIIFDELAKDLLREVLRQMPALLRTPANFCASLNADILRTIPNAPDTICEQTARRWLFHLGFRPTRRNKTYYVDGHERPDVVEYRNAFLQRMVEVERRAGHWEGAEMTDFVQPVLQEGENKIIIVTHDESIFYSNEAVAVVWEEDQHKHLRPKSRGRSQHVSGFCCPCHGFIEEVGDQPEEPLGDSSFKIITPGKNADGYWTNDDLIEQLQTVMPLFQRVHPDCDLLFLFDNSGNHHKKVPGGLCAADRNLNDGGKPALQRDGWWDDADGVRHVQSMVTQDGKAKGVKTILQERGLWPAENPPLLADARVLLDQQPDFQQQGEWLKETIEAAGHTIDYYPKFHCELNYIEMIWGYAKQQLRRNCTYSFPAMCEQLPNTLHDIPLSFHRRALRHCFRFMTGYRQGLHGPLLDYTLKKYKGHRAIPTLVGAELFKLKSDFEKQREAKWNGKMEGLK